MTTPRISPRNPYPYNMGWNDLIPEPNRQHLTPSSTIRSLRWLLDTSSSDEDLERVLDAALALAMRMSLDPEHSQLTRGQILNIALDTAIIWERG